MVTHALRRSLNKHPAHRICMACYGTFVHSCKAKKTNPYRIEIRFGCPIDWRRPAANYDGSTTAILSAVVLAKAVLFQPEARPKPDPTATLWITLGFRSRSDSTPKATHETDWTYSNQRHNVLQGSESALRELSMSFHKGLLQKADRQLSDRSDDSRNYAPSSRRVGLTLSSR